MSETCKTLGTAPLPTNPRILETPFDLFVHLENSISKYNNEGVEILLQKLQTSIKFKYYKNSFTQTSNFMTLVHGHQSPKTFNYKYNMIKPFQLFFLIILS